MIALKLKDRSGIALMVVLIILMVMAIFSVIVISQSMSQSKTSHSQMEQIVAEELAKGYFWKSYNSQTPGGSFNSASYVIPLNNRNYSVTVSLPNGSAQAQVDVTY